MPTASAPDVGRAFRPHPQEKINKTIRPVRALTDVFFIFSSAENRSS
jgi:hypothetical protein